jgi:hypothetical protein
MDRQLSRSANPSRIDQIARAGKTFSYADGTPKGLLIGKKATFLIATGGVYDAQTQMASFNFVEPYLRSIFGFLGVTDATFLTAGGTTGKTARRFWRRIFRRCKRTRRRFTAPSDRRNKCYRLIAIVNNLNNQESAVGVRFLRCMHLDIQVGFPCSGIRRREETSHVQQHIDVAAA